MRIRSAIFILSFVGAYAAPPAVFQVAPGGPLSTIEQARDAVRDLKRKHGGKLPQPVTVMVHAGTYTLSQPLRFTPEDSGTAECPVTYAAFQGEKPVFSGGRPISGWKEVAVDGKHLWAAEIPAVRDGKWYFRQLWINGRRATRARSPNEGYFRVAAVPGLDMSKPYQEGQRSFQFNSGEISRWKDMEDVELIFMTFWICHRRGIAELDEASRTVTLSKASQMRLTDGFGRTGHLARYYVENAFELLDAPGEWYLNRKAGMLYYMPMPGEQIASAQAVAPVLEQLLIVEGNPKEGQLVEHLTFRGLTFTHSEWWLPSDGTENRYQGQAAASMPGAVQLTGARHVDFEKCSIGRVSSYAFHFSRGCDHDRLSRCDLFDIGAGGVKIGEPDRIGNVPPNMQQRLFPGDPKLETHDIEVSDSEIRQGGRIFRQGMGVLVGQSYNNLISHNHIFDFYQIGISVGWSWGYGKSLARNNIVEYNHIHQIGQGQSSDLGGIYTLGMQPGTVLRGNLIHDVKCADYVGRGIYLDEGTSDVVVENNILYDTSTGGFGMNYGRHNTIRNNIFAFGELSQIEPVGNMSKAPPGNSYVLESNIFYWKPGQNILRGPWQPKPTDDLVMRRNLYWQEGGGEFRFGSRTFEEWQKLGLDAGSKIADPQFLAPEKADFRVKANSPATQIGFKPFDLSTAGPRK